MLNSIGLENVGLEKFRSEKLPKLRALGATIVASIGGETPDELVRLLDALGNQRGVGGFEINFSCPNVARGGARYWAVPRRLERTLARLRPLTRAALIAKLSPDVTSIADLARACEQGGADAVTAVNTFVGMAVDLDARRSRLGRATGGLSGPAIKPLALARCHEAARAVRIPVIGSGGIMDARDALEFIAVGAAAVQVGTASFIRPARPRRVLEGMRDVAGRARHSASRRRGAERCSKRERRRRPRRGRSRAIDRTCPAARSGAAWLAAHERDRDRVRCRLRRRGAGARSAARRRAGDRQGRAPVVHRRRARRGAQAARTRPAGVPRSQAARHSEHRRGRRGRSCAARRGPADRACHGRRGDDRGRSAWHRDALAAAPRSWR